MARQDLAGLGAAGRGAAGHGNARQGFYKGKAMANIRFQKSADTKILEGVLAECPVGGTVTYEAMSKAIGRDVRKHAASSIHSARRWLLNEKGMVFDVIQNEGYVRLDDKLIVSSMERDRKKLHRVTSVSLKKLASVNYNNLDNETKKKHTVASAQMGALAMFSQKSASNRIEAGVKDTSAVVSIGETLKMFTE
jgi:hypothetical protein